MALTKRGVWWHASAADDIDEYLLRHVLSRHCRKVPHRVAHGRCAGCGAGAFDLFVDKGERAQRVCTACQAEHNVCDLDAKFDASTAGEIVCTCMYSECEVAVGFALMDPDEGKSEGPVGHLYVAGRCTECGLCGVYTEWSPAGDYSFASMADSV